MGKRAMWRIGMAIVVVFASGCSKGSTSSSPEAASATSPTTPASNGKTTTGSGAGAATSGADDGTTTPSEGTDSTLPAGAIPGLDDFDDNGELDPTCGTRDFGAGLVLRVPCTDPGTSPEPSEGTVLVPGSLFAFPGYETDIVHDISANAVQGRDAAGARVVVFFISSDTLFDVGASDLNGPATETLGGMASRIGATWPTAAVQVRGHTDATGTASTNQTLSEQRAAKVAAFLGTSGIAAGQLTSVGLGSTVPIALETNPDGSENTAGRHEDRRVEVVVHLP